jgi:CarD family transcriptional regulator
MKFRIGDTVIHLTYGLGEIIDIDEKELFGRKERYYVVQVQNLSLWVPIHQEDQGSLRYPTPAHEFERLITILNSPGEPLADDRLERKNQLLQKMRDGTLESICQVIRDLTYHRKTKKLNDNDVSTLNQAKNFLSNEWGFSLSIPCSQAGRELDQLLIDHYA